MIKYPRSLLMSRIGPHLCIDVLFKNRGINAINIIDLCATIPLLAKFPCYLGWEDRWGELFHAHDLFLFSFCLHKFLWREILMWRLGFNGVFPSGESLTVIKINLRMVEYWVSILRVLLFRIMIVKIENLCIFRAFWVLTDLNELWDLNFFLYFFRLNSLHCWFKLLLNYWLIYFSLFWLYGLYDINYFPIVALALHLALFNLNQCARLPWRCLLNNRWWLDLPQVDQLNVADGWLVRWRFMEDPGLFVAGFPAHLYDLFIYALQDICLEKGVREVLAWLDVLIDVRDFQIGAHMAEIVLGHWNGYKHLILAFDVFLSSWIVLERLLFHGSFLISHFFVFMLVELSKFFVCGDDVAEWVSILPQFVKVHFPIC